MDLFQCPTCPRPGRGLGGRGAGHRRREGEVRREEESCYCDGQVQDCRESSSLWESSRLSSARYWYWGSKVKWKIKLSLLHVIKSMKCKIMSNDKVFNFSIFVYLCIFPLNGLQLWEVWETITGLPPSSRLIYDVCREGEPRLLRGRGGLRCPGGGRHWGGRGGVFPVDPPPHLPHRHV